MSRRKKTNSFQILGIIIYLLIVLCTFLVKLTFDFLMFVFRMITFYRTQYKAKSGNGFFKTYFDKGFWGEYQLYKKLIKVFGEDKLLTNIYLPSKNIDNTEIDVLGVHDGIIYCYEVKNYGGYIYGRQNDREWTQVLKFRTKNKFYNPLRQNYAHTKALEEYLEIDEKDIIPMVVFSNRANLSNVNTDTKIYRMKDRFYKSDLKGKLSDFEIIQKLSNNTNVSETIKEEHIEQINLLKEKRC